MLWLYPFAFVALLLITAAMTMFVSALNVRYRDVQHLIGLALLVWFWLTPIVYAAGTAYANMLEYAHGAVAVEDLPAEPAGLGRDRVPARAVSLVGRRR